MNEFWLGMQEDQRHVKKNKTRSEIDKGKTILLFKSWYTFTFPSEFRPLRI